ncbi:MAG: metallophosphoesterase, partial [Betaproteobacteria bacterium]|nr:metallophosphoesterase [Betaproteobacteria bacterium]
MKINILSDLHIEFFAYEPAATDVDVVILAGDIGVGLSGIRWASHAFPGKEIIYVLGNHEYYRQERQSLLRQAKSDALRSGIHLLENDEVVIQGTRFLGSTLWTDFELFGGEAKDQCLQVAAMGLNDFRIIRESGTQPFTPEASLELHVSSVAWLAHKLNDESFDGPTVVITHHAPHQGSVAEKHKEDLL